MSEKRTYLQKLDEPAEKCAKHDEQNIATLSQDYCCEGFLEAYAKAWADKASTDHDKTGAKLCQEPFCHGVLPNFIEDGSFLDSLQEELNALEFKEKSNDLYQFHQSKDDLKSASSPCITSFRKLLCGAFRQWLSQVTSIPFNDTLDMFCARYRNTDTLCCHDDELEGRRIAYIFYLVRSWTAEDGGALDLYSTDENIQPKDVVKSVLPVRNNFVFFEVSPGSYHQVAEILSKDKCRLSISGWFHGPLIQRPSPYLEAPRPLKPCGSIDDDVFFDWINPVYMSVQAQSSIQEKFEVDSEIELQDFLIKEKYDELVAAFRTTSESWRVRGPPNKRCYDVLDYDSMPSAVRTCQQLLESDAVFLILSNMTGLELHELAGSSSAGDSESDDEGEAGSSQRQPKREKCKARCRTEVRRWRHGCYTLVHDTDTEGADFALDLVLHIDCQGWQQEFGGYTSYIAKDEDEELLTVPRKENSLALVYRDRDTLKFVKHVNNSINRLPQNNFYDVAAVYFE